MWNNIRNLIFPVAFFPLSCNYEQYWKGRFQGVVLEPRF